MGDGGDNPGGGIRTPFTVYALWDTGGATVGAYGASKDGEVKGGRGEAVEVEDMGGDQEEGEDGVFSGGGQQLESADSFKFLGKVLDKLDNNRPALSVDLGKARKSWGCFVRILTWEGADTRVSGMFYHALMKAVSSTVLRHGCSRL